VNNTKSRLYKIVSIENDTIIHTNYEGDIISESISSGEVNWEYEHSGFMVVDQLLIDDKICFTTISGIICLDKNTGEQVFELNNDPVTRTTRLKTPNDNIIIISQHEILEITSDTGEVIKHIDTNPATLINGDPILYGDEFYILGGKFYGEQGISKYTYDDHKEWTYPAAGDHSLESSISFINDESIVFVVGRSPVNSKIVSSDLNGAILWEQPYKKYSSPRIILPFKNSLVFVSNNDLTFISYSNGELERTAHLPKKYFTLKEIHGNHIILQNSDTV
jgi:outer membrane protein assembly factor BamB